MTRATTMTTTRTIATIKPTTTTTTRGDDRSDNDDDNEPNPARTDSGPDWTQHNQTTPRTQFQTCDIQKHARHRSRSENENFAQCRELGNYPRQSRARQLSTTDESSATIHDSRELNSRARSGPTSCYQKK